MQILPETIVTEHEVSEMKLVKHCRWHEET